MLRSVLSSGRLFSSLPKRSGNCLVSSRSCFSATLPDVCADKHREHIGDSAHPPLNPTEAEDDVTFGDLSTKYPWEQKRNHNFKKLKFKKRKNFVNRNDRGYGMKDRHGGPSNDVVENNLIYHTSGAECTFEEHCSDVATSKGFHAAEAGGRRRRHKGHTVSRERESSQKVVDAEGRVLGEDSEEIGDRNVKSLHQAKLDIDWVQREWRELNKIEKQKAAIKKRADRTRQLDLLNDPTLNKVAQEREQNPTFKRRTMKRKETIYDINSNLEVGKPLSVMDDEKEECYVTTREEVDEFLRARQKSLRGNAKSGREDLADEKFGTLARGELEALFLKQEKKATSQITEHEESVVEDKDDVQFGTLASEELEQFFRQEDLDDGKFYADDAKDAVVIDHHLRLDPNRGPYSVQHYGRKILKLGKKGQIYEAIQVLETEMLVERRILPNYFVYTVLICELGKVGYTKKAFQLYNRMKKRGLYIPSAVYTGLFNACANSPWPEDGLRRAHDLLIILRELDFEFNQTHYNCMIKTFGKCGDLRMAFELLDEMQEAGHYLDLYTFSQILIACNSDKHAGLKHIIEVWRKMRKRRLTPNIQCYNLLLHAIRDCGVGEPYFANELLRRSSSRQSHQLDSPSHSRRESAALTSGSKEFKLDNLLRLDPAIDSREEKHCATNDGDLEETVIDKPNETHWGETGETFSMTEVNGNQLETVDQDAEMVPWWNIVPEHNAQLDLREALESDKHLSLLNMDVPNILNPRGLPPGKVIRLEGLDTPQARIALVGGLPGLLSHMQKDGVVPNEKTFIMLASCIPLSKWNDEALLQSMRSHGLKPTRELYNEMIRKYCSEPSNYIKNRKVYKKGSRPKEIVTMMVKDGISPSYKTFGSLATGCHSKEDGRALLKDMKSLDMVPTLAVINILLRRTHGDFSYALELCKEMKRLEIEPDAQTLRYLETEIHWAKRAIVDMERGKDIKTKYKKREHFPRDFGRFMKWYSPWIKETLLGKDTHPWQQFREPTCPTEQDQRTETLKKVEKSY